jgi:hypothetical protein
LTTKEDKDNHKLAQQWYYDAKTLALHSKLYPKKVLFEGANGNVIAFDYKGMNSQKFGFNSKEHIWFNTEM